ncbi:hypothetical protein OS493_025866 [Desmophyllum pertusum]|uniref:CUB domain-containing protein n=1 Tax=Desmophyllum pertusum TaxID=174260 RepID=A0A9W9YZ51_9CNID|nr:hypothetical protein OS493_025866 [Desmophyllum pertusum]
MVLYTAGLNIIDCSTIRQWVTASASYKTTITSPNYPFNYDNNLECAWLIEVDSDISFHGYIVKVTFNDFKLELSDPPCTNDVLKFYDGMSSLSGLLGGYCDTHHPEVIYSTRQYLYVKFHTDAYYYDLTNKGFSFSFSAVKQEEAAGICRSTDGSNKVRSLIGTSGTFFSPNYPVPYPNDVRCIWTISVPAGKRVKLTFEDFDLDKDFVTCDYQTEKIDYVQIRDGQVSEVKSLRFIADTRRQGL